MVQTSLASGLDFSDQRYALLCAGSSEAANQLAIALADGTQLPNAEELTFLARHAKGQEVYAAMLQWLSQPSMNHRCLKLLLENRNYWQNDALAVAMAKSVRGLVAKDSNPTNISMLLRVARELRSKELEGDVVALFEDGDASPMECLKALIELDSQDHQLYFQAANASLPGENLRRVSVEALAGISGNESFEMLMELWPGLENSTRKAGLQTLLNRKEGAQGFLEAVMSNRIGVEAIDSAILVQLKEHLGNVPELQDLQERLVSMQISAMHFTGGGNDYAATDLSLNGPFTIEAWVRLENGISNADGLLCAVGLFDLNFHDARLRLWLSGPGDVIIARQAVKPQTWTHFAFVRDQEDVLSLYLNGELDTSVKISIPNSFSHLDVARTLPGAGTSAWITEFRIWDTARSASEIGANYRMRLQRQDADNHLKLLLPGDAISLSGAAKFEGVLDGPPVLTPAESKNELERFAKYRSLAEVGGDVEKGKQLFAISCAVCHQVSGVGGLMGPNLDSVASKGTEGLLRSILTPNAGVESGYRILNIKTMDGQLLQGFLASEDEFSLTLRRVGREDLRIPRKDIQSSRFDSLSLMPEGLLDAMTPVQVADLFSYLRSLN